MTSFDWLSTRSSGPMDAGAVILHSPSHAFQAPGGGEVQLARTARHLEAVGVRVRPFNPWTDRLEEGRLLHLFGMSREGLELARVAGARAVPVVLSPICWFEPSALWGLAPSRVKGARDLGAWALRRAVPRLPGWRRELLGIADAVLPNSESEGEQLVRLFKLDRRKIRVVPNGVEPDVAEADPALFRQRVGAGGFVLYAGRIEPRKNVLGLVRGAKRGNLPLVVIGDPVPGCESYASRCKAEGGAGVTWVPRMDADDPALASAFRAARVFALPSWFETPGLAALEAALAGCAVVITPFGSTREYFGDRAFYARPGKVGEIAGALQTAWEAGRGGTELAELVRRRYLWATVARRTAEVYDEIAPTG
ncbi:glycosyltransferase [Tautonia plasticadhaerens]|uniref:N-acetylgalactosamine-N, N'-diacetylbacillosaminyl-diphospho-undecaprenol 4-alpha-N-acetylgalactosaminyltransferase n=1 Tax=Tautonia plasticadhaerens TaxID=2527974 RepID=A0A518H052_9BACT|nr:glycosyltransferase [Tautonia plasticadhaerens]QDV34215.1 N-acetylgalactosamine-N,N'-diacetylbacillosaminyl-diphospho-undecaprenol 4-alpha-N-acetylgalactosaminyltransferase [Tautonia plasticadhaerens]